MILTPHHRDFEKCIRGLTGRHHLWRVFGDFVEMAALSLANVVVKNPDREARYMEIIGAYEHQEAQEFPRLLGITVQALELECDFLGEVFMHLDLGGHWHGQFFTPMALASMMVEMTIGDEDTMRAQMEHDAFITVHEPASGAGAMIIAFAHAMRRRGFNPQQQMHVQAIDVDRTAAFMCYVQLSLLHIPAIVYIGNTLTLEIRDTFRTCAYDLGLWDYRLHRRRTREQPVHAARGGSATPPLASVVLPAEPDAPPARKKLRAQSALDILARKANVPH